MKILYDYQNYPVRFTDERLSHILQHPEMSAMEAEIEITLSNPQEVRRSKSDNTVFLSYRYYMNTLVGEKWLCIAVKYLKGDAFVITDRIKKGELIWHQV